MLLESRLFGPLEEKNGRSEVERVWVAGLPEFEAEAERGTSDAERLLAKEVIEKVNKGLDKEEEEMFWIRYMATITLKRK